MIARAAAAFALAALFTPATPGPAAAACSPFEAPCHGAFCSVYDPWPCVPEIQYPLGGGLRSTIVSASADADGQPRLHQRLAQATPKELNTLNDVFDAFRACWQPPAESKAHPGMEVTVRFSLNRKGEIFGEPRFTFVTANVSAEVKAVYKRAVADTLTRCTPLTVTPSLGNALAGQPISLRFFDDRGIKKVEHHGR